MHNVDFQKETFRLADGEEQQKPLMANLADHFASSSFET